MGMPYAFLRGLFDHITIQKSLQINNPRLGILLLFLQVAVVVLVAIQIFLASAWNTVTQPVSFGLEMWTEAGNRSAVQNTQVKHCADPASFAYKYSNSLEYTPIDCRPLPRGEAFVKNGLNIFFPTHFWQETYVTEKPSSLCASLTCANGEVKTDDGLYCQCSTTFEYLVQNPEENLLFLNHGFAVDSLDAFGTKGRIKSRSILEHDKHEILTVITKTGDRNTKCLIGGRSSWPQTFAQHSINGPLKDWIACGGQHLDSAAEDSKSGLPGETEAPTARLIGLSLVINLIYTNDHSEDHEGIVCYVEIAALPVWNSMNTVAYTLLPTATDKTSIYRTRYAFGVSVSVQSSGTFQWFDFSALLLIFSSSVVLLSLPTKIIQFVALSLLGRASKIYSAIAVEEFKLVDRLHGVCARLLGSKASFEALTAASGRLTLQALENGLCEVLQEGSSAGRLEKKEIQDLSLFIMSQMDPSGNGSISLPEFLHACNSNDDVGLPDLAAFFDKDAKKSLLEGVFSDKRPAIKRSKSWHLRTGDTQESDKLKLTQLRATADTPATTTRAMVRQTTPDTAWEPAVLEM